MADTQPILRTTDRPRRNLAGLRHIPTERQFAMAAPHLQREPQHLFDCWDEVAQRVRESEEIKLFLDFDGTLVDFSARPNQVRMPRKARQALSKLARHPRVQPAIVSGRRRATLIHLIGIAGVRYLGLYGWEDRPGCRMAKRTMEQLSRVRKALAGLPHSLRGIYLENKRLSLAVHSRGVSPDVEKVARARVRKALAAIRGDLHILRGEHIWEVAPRQIRGKGPVIRKELRNAKAASLPIYIGDDLTDEPAFAALPNGITILVGPVRQTNARFILRNAAEVRTFLTRLEAVLP